MRQARVTKTQYLRTFAAILTSSLIALSEAPLSVAVAQQSMPGRAGTQQFRYDGYKKIWYATTRLNENGSVIKPIYGAKRHLDLGFGSLGSTEYGQADAAKPLAMGKLATSGNWANFHTLMNGTDAAFLAGKVSAQVQGEPAFINAVSGFDGTIVVFVHGYDESFSKSIQDTALISNELEQQTPGQQVFPISFSWPSFDSTKDYAADEANLEWSKKSFTQLIARILVAKKAQTKLVIVAHSMGCRLVFDLLNLPEIYKKPLIEKIVLSSPDYDYYQALDNLPELEQLVQNKIYVLVSERDGPLLTSQALHKMPRLGKPTDTYTDDNSIASKLSDITSNPLLRNLIRDAGTVLLPTQSIQRPEITTWLRNDPQLSQELGIKSRFYDITDLANFQSELGHRLCWPVIARLILPDESMFPLSVEVVHKMPDKNYLEQSGGKPKMLFRFYKVTSNRFGLIK